DIIDALKEEKDKKEFEDGQQGGSGSGAGGKPPLLPPIAQLKLVKAMQNVVNTQTAAAGKALQNAASDAEKTQFQEQAAQIQKAPEQKSARPKLPDMVSPDAAKQLDDQDLLNKLTGKTSAGSDEGGGPKEKMTAIMDRMTQSQSRLSKEKDPGVLTQEVQSRI